MKYNLTDSILRGITSGVVAVLILIFYLDNCHSPIVKTSDPVQEVLKDSTPENLTFGDPKGSTFTSDSNDNWNLAGSVQISNGEEWRWVKPRQRKLCKPRPVLIDTCRVLYFIGTQGIKVTRIGDSVIIGFDSFEPPVPDHRQIDMQQIQLFDSLIKN